MSNSNSNNYELEIKAKVDVELDTSALDSLDERFKESEQVAEKWKNKWVAEAKARAELQSQYDKLASSTGFDELEKKAAKFEGTALRAAEAFRSLTHAFGIDSYSDIDINSMAIDIENGTSTAMEAMQEFTNSYGHMIDTVSGRSSGKIDDSQFASVTQQLTGITEGVTEALSSMESLDTKTTDVAAGMVSAFESISSITQVLSDCTAIVKDVSSVMKQVSMSDISKANITENIVKEGASEEIKELGNNLDKLSTDVTETKTELDGASDNLNELSATATESSQKVGALKEEMKEAAEAVRELKEEERDLNTVSEKSANLESNVNMDEAILKARDELLNSSTKLNNSLPDAFERINSTVPDVNSNLGELIKIQKSFTDSMTEASSVMEVYENHLSGISTAITTSKNDDGELSRSAVTTYTKNATDKYLTSIVKSAAEADRKYETMMSRIESQRRNLTNLPESKRGLIGSELDKQKSDLNEIIGLYRSGQTTIEQFGISMTEVGTAVTKTSEKIKQQSAETKAANTEAKNIDKELMQIANAENKYQSVLDKISSKQEKISGVSGIQNIQGYSNLDNQISYIKELMRQYSEGEITIKEFELGLKELDTQYKKSSSEIDGYINSVKEQDSAYKDSVQVANDYAKVSKKISEQKEKIAALDTPNDWAAQNKDSIISNIESQEIALNSLVSAYERGEITFEEFKVSLKSLDTQYVNSIKEAKKYADTVSSIAEANNLKNSFVDLINRYERKKDSLFSTNPDLNIKDPSDDVDDLNGYISSINLLTETYNKGSISAEEFSEKFDIISSAAKESANEINSAFKLAEGSFKLKEDDSKLLSRISGKVKESGKYERSFSAAGNSKDPEVRSAYENIRRLHKEYVTLEKNTLNSKGATADFKKRLFELDKELETNALKIRESGKDHTSFGESFKRAFRQVLDYGGAARIIQEGIEQVKKMVRTVIELDTAMTELKKVTDESDATYEAFGVRAGSTAREVGATISDVIKSTADFARLGFTLDESESLAKSALIYKNVGDGIEDINAASESIISTMQAFGVEASKSMDIVDKFNVVGNNFAISSKGVGEALMRSASAMHAAGNTLDETIAIATAANTVVQNPASVGTSMKTMSMYVRAAKTEAEEAGESTEGMADSVSKLRDEIMALTGVDIQLDENTFKSTYQILEEISEVWDGLTDISRANVLEKLGGKRNANVITAIIENFDVARDAFNKSKNEFENSAIQENEKYLNSIEGHIARFKASFESLSKATIDGDILKFGVDTGRFLLDTISAVVSLTDKLGGAKVVLLDIAAIIATANMGKIKEKLKEKLGGLKDSLGNFGKKFMKGFNEAEASGKKFFGSMSGGFKKIINEADSASVAIMSITAVLTVVSAAINALERRREEISQIYSKAVAKKTEDVNKSKEILKAYSEYEKYNQINNRTEEQEQSLNDALNSVTEALGDKAAALDNLTKGTKKYQDTLRGLIQDEQDQALKESTSARAMAGVALTEQLKSITNFDADRLFLKGMVDNYGGGGNTPEAYIRGINALKQAMREAEEAGNIDDGLYKQMVKSWDVAEDAYETYVQAFLNEQYLLNGGAPSSSKEFTKLSNSMSKSLVDLGFTSDMVSNELNDFFNSVGLNASNFSSAISNSYATAIATISNMKTTVQAISTAMSENSSEAGLSVETMDALSNAFANLEGYDPSKLFEKTTTGIRLNVKELGNLQRQYEEIGYGEISNVLEELSKKYQRLTYEINQEADAQTRIRLYAERNAIAEEIESVKALASEYGGLTSAYDNWLEAKKQEDERSKYEDIGKSMDSVEKLIKQGWVGDAEVESYLNYILSKSARSGDNVLDFNSIKKNIKGTKFSIEDFFKFDSSGNITTKGLQNFLDAAHQKFGEEFVSISKDGSYALNVANEDLGRFADGLNMSEEAVLDLLRALRDADFEVSFDDANYGIDDAIKKSETAIDVIKRLKEEGKVDVDFVDFDVTSENLDDIKSQIKQANTLLSKFRKSNGEVDLELEGAEEAKNILETLISQKQTLQHPIVMSFSSSSQEAQTEAGQYILKVKNFIKAMGDLELAISMGIDIPAAEEKAQAAFKELNDNNFSVKLGLDTSGTKEEALTALDSIGDEKIVKIVTEGDKKAESSLTETAKKPLIIEMITRFYDAAMKQILKTEEKVVKIVTKSSGSTSSGISNQTKGVTPYSPSNAEGTAHAQGTAKARGDWRVKETGEGLGGELGQEIVVRNGRYFTIGDDGAEFFKYRKGDIIFNHEQSKQLFKYGRILSGNRRGQAYVEGSAFVTASGSFSKPSSSGISSASSKTKSSSSSSKSSRKSSKSSKSSKDEQTWFEKQYEQHQHLVAMEAETMEAYLNWLVDAYKKAYNEGIIELSDFYKY